MKKSIFSSMILCIVVCITLIGCQKATPVNQDVENKQEVMDDKKIIKIGTRAVSEKILEEAREDFEAKGYEMEIVIFDDAITPNIALAEGSIDANFYQHLPYFEKFNADRGTNLTYSGKYIYYSPIQMFSSKIKSLDELLEGSKVAIPNDVTNQQKGLKLLVKEGLIKLEEGIEEYSMLNIAENTRNLEFIEMEQTQMPVSIDDVDAIVINPVYMIMAGLDTNDSISNHSSGEEYPVIIAIRPENKKDKWVIDFEDSMTTDNMRDFFLEEYKGQYIPMF